MRNIKFFMFVLLFTLIAIIVFADDVNEELKDIITSALSIETIPEVTKHFPLNLQDGLSGLLILMDFAKMPNESILKSISGLYMVRQIKERLILKRKGNEIFTSTGQTINALYTDLKKDALKAIQTTIEFPFADDETKIQLKTWYRLLEEYL